MYEASISAYTKLLGRCGSCHWVRLMCERLLHAFGNEEAKEQDAA